MVLIFANTLSLAGSIVVLVCFSVFVQAAEGTSYGIVPYVIPQTLDPSLVSSELVETPVLSASVLVSVR